MAGKSVEEFQNQYYDYEQGAEESPAYDYDSVRINDLISYDEPEPSPEVHYSEPSAPVAITPVETPQEYPKPDYTKRLSEYQSAYYDGTGVPANVSDSMKQFSQVNVATQEYANDIQKRIIQDYYGYQNDDNYQGMLSKTYTEQTYDYLKRKNKNANDTAWSEPDPNDELFNRMPTWIEGFDLQRQGEAKIAQQTPTDKYTLAEQNAYNSMTTDAQRAVMDAKDTEHGNWFLMSNWDKAKYLLIPSNNKAKVDDAPEIVNTITQNLLPTVMSTAAGSFVGSTAGAVIGGVAGSVIPVVGTAAGAAAGAKIGADIGAVVFGGASVIQAVTGKEVPVVSDIMTGINYVGDKTEQFLGTRSAAYQEAKSILGENATAIELYKEMGEIMSDPANEYLWEVGKYSYEVGSGTFIDELTNTIYNTAVDVSNNLFGTNYEHRDINEVSRNNLARSGWEETVEGTRGGSSLIQTYTPIFTGLVDAAMAQGFTKEEAVEFAHMNMQDYILNYQGTTGLVNDFVAQSYQDPTNFLSYATAKIAQGVGNLVGDQSLANAGRAAAGNPIIDALDPISQPIVETLLSPFDRNNKSTVDILKTHGSQGWDVIQRTWSNNLRGEPEAKSLSGIQKAIAGLDDEGRIKDMLPVQHNGNKLHDWLADFFSKTEETKMYDMAQETTTFVGDLLFDKGIRLEELPDIMNEITGKAPVRDDSPLKGRENSAVMNTLREGFANVPDDVIENITMDVINYRNFGTNREILNTVADELKMKPKDILDALENKKDGSEVPQVKKNGVEIQKVRDDLLKKIRREEVTYTDPKTGKVYDTEAVIENIDKFKGNRQQYSETYMKANVLSEVAKAVDDYNLKRYNIEPDEWWSRMSDLTKSMQSVALLNFSPSYIVNNFLNNMITRTVTGVGGVESNYVKNLNEERGLFFSRSDEDVQAEAYHNTAETIKGNKRKNDAIQNFNDLFIKATDNKIFKGVNNIPIEKMETNAAAGLGFKRYWDATWENNLPVFPKEWDLLGIDDATKMKIHDIALDSPNFGEFMKRLSGEITFPSADSVISNALSGLDAKSKMILRDYISKTPWISETLSDALKTNDLNKIGQAIDSLKANLTNDIGFKNVVQQASTFDAYRTIFSGEGIPSIADARDLIDSMHNGLWIDQTKQNVSLFLDRIVKYKNNEQEFRPAYERNMMMQQGDYNIVRGYDVMITAAQCESLGLSNDLYVKAMENTMQKYDIHQEQVRQNHLLYVEYGTKDSPQYDYEYYKKSRLEMLEKTQAQELQCDTELNKIMVDYLRKNLDGSKDRIDVYENALNDVIEMKRKLYAKELTDLEKTLDMESPEDKWKYYYQQKKIKENAKNNIDIRQSQANDIFRSLDSAITKDPKVTQPMSLDNTLKVMLIIDEANTKKSNQGDWVKHYVDKSDPMKVFEPIDYKNSKVNTSFWEYAEQTIDPSRRAAIQVLYDNGMAVPLGEANTTTQNITQVVNEYRLINPNAELNTSEFVQAKCYPVNTQDGTAVAGVYHNGELIGYVIDGMQTKVHVGDNDFPVIGMSKDTPNTYLVLVQDRIWEVTVGKPNNAEFSPYAEMNFHPVQQNGTPTIEPSGSAYLESSQPLREFFDLLEVQATKSLQDARNNKSILGDLTPEQREAVMDYANNSMKQAYSAQRYQTQKYGDAMVDFALLNYNDRYGFDKALTAAFPYQFWMTRSIANWGKRMITQPKWFTSYAKLENLMEKNKRDIQPSGLNGTVGLLMPNMGDGMGSTIHFDPFGQIFPFQQFYNAADYWNYNYGTVKNNTLRIIEEYYNDGRPLYGQIITDEMYEEAMQGTGELFNKVFEEQKRLDESDLGATGLASIFIKPNVLVDALIKKAKGKDASISNSPMYRLGTTTKAIGDETSAEWFTNLMGDILQTPDKLFRKALNIEANPDGNFFDYYITQYVTNMWIEGDISEDERNNALINREGRAYDEAIYRYQQQQAIRQQGGALGVEIGQSLGGNKSTSVMDIANAALASAFGGKVFPMGEQIYREERQVKKIVDEANDKELTSAFYKQLPQYSVHNWTYEDDEDVKVHKVLVSTVWDTYNALPSTQKTAFANGNERFRYYFLDADTRATDYIPDDELKTWIRTMRGEDIEFTQQQINQPMQDGINIKWYADSVQSDWERLQRDINAKFPNYKTLNEGYAECPESKKKQYLQDFPELQQAWDYKKAALRANPALAVYDNDRSASYNVGDEYDNLTDALQDKLTDWVKKNLNNYLNNGWKMNADAEHALKTVYTSLGTNIPYEEWLKNVSKSY